MGSSIAKSISDGAGEPSEHERLEVHVITVLAAKDSDSAGKLLKVGAAARESCTGGERHGRGPLRPLT
jgi:hypothetical protein